MVTSTLPTSEAEALRNEFERRIKKPGQGLPDILPLESLKIRHQIPRVLGIPVESVEGTLNRVWGNGDRLQVKEFDERWRPDKPHVAFLRTTVGDKVLKTEKPDTGQEGVVNQALAPLLMAELNLRTVKIGVDGLRQRN